MAIEDVGKKLATPLSVKELGKALNDIHIQARTQPMVAHRDAKKVIQTQAKVVVHAKKAKKYVGARHWEKFFREECKEVDWGAWAADWYTLNPKVHPNSPYRHFTAKDWNDFYQEWTPQRWSLHAENRYTTTWEPEATGSQSSA
jgi:endogenous inhibitor of DNA gyrase (YacG/DUF329 family)